MIYFVRRHDGSIKIGRARNCLSRLAGLRAEHGPDLNLIAVVSEDQFSETALHRRFDSGRRDGEWFEPSASLLEFIQEHGVGLPAESPCGPESLVKLDKSIASKARYVADTTGMRLSDYLANLIRPIVDRDFERATKHSDHLKDPL